MYINMTGKNSGLFKITLSLQNVLLEKTCYLLYTIVVYLNKNRGGKNMFADKGIISVKHDVLNLVAKLAFEGKLDEERDNIPYKIIEGPAPQFRCCIYKEREIIRQRVRLAEGKAPGEKDDGNVIQVIPSACADCPIASYIITDNCQNCIGKSCMNSCKFGAITMDGRHPKIDPNKCRECGLCAKNCPFHVIVHLQRPCKFSCPVDAITYDENGISVIDDEKCIKCGQCIHKCPFGAIGSKTFIVDVINAIKSDRPVYALLAPATEGQFEGVTMASWRKALKNTGFTDMVEVGLGGDMTTSSEAEEWWEAHEKGEKKTTSCCPAFVNMIRKHFPESSDLISTTVSPMCAVSRMIKAKEPDAYTVFIGPCIAKKSEVVDQKIEGNADAVLAFSELHAIMLAVDTEHFEDIDGYQESSKFGKKYGNSGGVTASVVEYLNETGRDGNSLSVCKASGTQDCKKVLLQQKVGKLKEDFIEGMACENGCVGGPSSYGVYPKFKKSRDEMIEKADGRSIVENLKNYDMESFSMHRE